MLEARRPDTVFSIAAAPGAAGFGTDDAGFSLLHIHCKGTAALCTNLGAVFIVQFLVSALYGFRGDAERSGNLVGRVVLLLQTLNLLKQ